MLDLLNCCFLHAPSLPIPLAILSESRDATELAFECTSLYVCIRPVAGALSSSSYLIAVLVAFDQELGFDVRQQDCSLFPNSFLPANI